MARTPRPPSKPSWPCATSGTNPTLPTRRPRHNKLAVSRNVYMEINRGIAVSPGVAIGPALVLDTEGFRIPQRFVAPAEVAAEVGRLRQALAEAVRDTRAQQETISDKLGPQYGAIFAAHIFLLTDPSLLRDVETLIADQLFAAEYAVSRVMRRHAKTLESLEGGHFASRITDVFDLEKRLLGSLLGQRRENLQHLSAAVIVLAHDLSPSETASLDTAHVHGFATEAGGRTSHTAIVAGVLEIPAVVGLGTFVTDVSGGDVAIVDGNRALLILNPDAEALERYDLTRS